MPTFRQHDCGVSGAEWLGEGGIFEGSSTLRIGSGKHDGHSSGILIPVSGGDIIIIPAGVTHSCADSGEDYRYVGVYPKVERTPLAQRLGNDPIDLVAAQRETFAVEMPKVDPVYGTEGPLMSLWMAEQAGASKSLSTGQPPSG
ncbi:predicted protein [Histoplasma capsulatum G186AR]|uniref:Cupin type-1 domain-containing protein n=1 Tax=Ajellomyces capsulatus (strain G186AR / H82 / ATCC MYA-2454 / RMSCC 2432) TaxID=447093 RepID=C0NS28_AJECG|nr:uncharacterized protein HCBG_05958 [Histoplasma capsulatum G186AR]EEH05694.1 predicted protein [Histoplasma capsulatum G186AR]